LGDTVILLVKEIKYVRIDSGNNIVIVFQDYPSPVLDKNTLGFRAKLITDPTGPNPDAEFKVRTVDREGLKAEEKIVQGSTTIKEDIPYDENR
jgi:hypothetical protein